MRTDPIAAILAAQDSAGWWAKPGSGYVPKYTSTVWRVVFLDQLGADQFPKPPTGHGFLVAEGEPLAVDAFG